MKNAYSEIYALDNYNNSCLHYAANSLNYNIFEYLCNRINNKLFIFKRNKYGLNAFDLLEKSIQNYTNINMIKWKLLYEKYFMYSEE